MMARRFPNCRIVALEVEHENYRLLCRNVASYENIIPMQRALWRRSGHVRIVDPTVHENAFTVGETDANDPDGIPSISINDLLKETGCPRLSLLKLDVEGSERDIFEEDPHEWMVSTDAMLVELHERSTPGCVAAFNKILRMRPHNLRRVGEYHFAVFY
jgi:FkbM family methyltransferase